MTRSASRSGSAGGYDVEGITWRRRRIQIVIMPTVREGQCDDTKKDLIEYEFFTRHLWNMMNFVQEALTWIVAGLKFSASFSIRSIEKKTI